uniref:Uridine diphosphate glucose pyrophosphatase isoform X1 n=1 Tax=Sus scrofa TaxID=9823 RepID=A0A480IXK6_PIG
MVWLEPVSPTPDPTASARCLIPQEVEASVSSSCHPSRPHTARGCGGRGATEQGPGALGSGLDQELKGCPANLPKQLQAAEQGFALPGTPLGTGRSLPPGQPGPAPALTTGPHGPAPLTCTRRPGAGRRGPGGSRTPPRLPCRQLPPARARADPRGRRTARRSPRPSRAALPAAPGACPGRRRPGSRGRGAPPRQHTQLAGTASPTPGSSGKR